MRTKLDNNGFKDFFINARTDTYLQHLTNPLEETLRRGQYYANHGADGLFVPGLIKEDEINIVINQVELLLNIMSSPQLTDMGKLKTLKVSRFSFGNALSDRLIAYTEEISKKIIDCKNTKILYHHAPVSLKFKNVY